MMKSMIPKTVMAGLLLSGLTATELKAATATTPSWQISGDLEEACSCHAACPCWFKSLPSRMNCNGVQAVFIKSGKYGKTPLEGLAVVQFAQSPEGKSMFESFGNWNFDNVYIDERANDEQRNALKEIATHLFPPAAKKREFHFVSISRSTEGAEHKVTVGNVGSFSGHLIEGGYQGSPKISNPPLADPTHQQFSQGQATKLVYKDSGQGWAYENSNYMFNQFKVNNKQYEKFEAEMARKMAQLNSNAGK